MCSTTFFLSLLFSPKSLSVSSRVGRFFSSRKQEYIYILYTYDICFVVLYLISMTRVSNKLNKIHIELLHVYSYCWRNSVPKQASPVQKIHFVYIQLYFPLIFMYQNIGRCTFARMIMIHCIYTFEQMYIFSIAITLIHLWILLSNVTLRIQNNYLDIHDNHSLAYCRLKTETADSIRISTNSSGKKNYH